MVSVIALKDLDQTTGPTPKGTVFEMDEAGAAFHFKIGNIDYASAPAPSPAPDDADD